MRIPIRLRPLAALALAAHSSTAPAATGPGESLDLAAVPAAVREHMMHGRWDAALGALSTLGTERPDDADLWLYLSAVALDLAGRDEEALATLRGLEESHPDSAWRFKSRFRRAEIHRDRRELREAEAIYEDAVRRLRSEERQGELAAIYMGFADELSTPPAGARPDDAVDYARARALYEKVLDLGAPRAVLDHATFRMALCRERAGEHAHALQAWERYLDAFDPERQRPLPPGFQAGAKLWEARHRLGRAQLAMQLLAEARRTFEDLVADLGEHLAAAGASLAAGERDALRELRGDASFDVAETYAGGRDAALLAVAAYRRFLEAFPDHPRRTRAAYAIAEKYREVHYGDEAVAAYDAVAASAPPPGAKAEGAEEHARLAMQALYLKGAVLQEQGHYGRAIEVFEEYARRYPTGSSWSAAQQGIVDSRFLLGQAHRSEERFAEARAAWTRFLALHPLDPRGREVQYELGALHVEEARAARREDADADVADAFRAAIAQWRTIVEKYPGSEEASRALFSIATLYEAELGELERAIETYRACDFGAFAREARARLAAMTEPSLAVLTERTWRSGEAASVLVRMRNVERLEVELYTLDLEAYFRKHLTHRRIEDLDLDLIAADERLEVEVEDYADHAPLERTVALPVEGPGVWVVAVTAGELRATTLVIRSDVDVVVKSSRREVLVFAEDMVAGAPAEDVRVLVGIPGAGEEPALEELATGADGVARLVLDEPTPADEVRVLATRGGHYASDGLSLSGLGVAAGLSPRGHVSTDRSAYRPGEVVHWRAIVRDVKDGRYSFEPGAEMQVSVSDSQGRPLVATRTALSDFGTLHGSLELPEQAPLGTYTVQVTRPGLPVFSGSFLVKQYQLEDVELRLEPDRAVVYRGEEVAVTAVASYYYGEPVAQSPLQVTLPDGRLVELSTDAAGRAEVTFSTRDVPGEGPQVFHAVLVEENVSAESEVYVAAHGYRARLTLDRDVVLAGRSFQVHLSTTSPAGDAVAREMTLKVLREVSRPGGRWAEELVLERLLATSEDGEAHASLSLERGGTYRLRAEGTDRFGNPVTTEGALTVSGDEDSVKLRLLAESQRAEVGATLALELVNRAGPGLALVTFEGETVLGYRLVQLERGVNRLELEVDHAHFPGFSVAAALMLGNELFEAEADFDVRRELRVAIAPAAGVVEPGAEAVVELVVTDQLGRPVAAELALAVVDDALFALYPDATPALSPFFEQGTRRESGLRTATSCTFRYEGLTVRVDASVLEEERRVEELLRWKESRQDLVDRLSALGYARGEAAGGPAAPPPPGRAGEEIAADAAEGEVLAGADEFFLGHGEKSARTRVNLRAAGREEEPAFFEADTAFWTPALVTDDRGRATVRFRMPTKSARWRLTARGVDRDTLLGEATATLVTRTDFFVELEAPHVLAEGDRPRIGARVHNLLDRTGSVRLTLTVTRGEEVLHVLPATLEIGGRGVVQHRFPALDGVPPDDLTLELAAEGRLAGEAVAAAAREDVPVRPWGLELHDAESGTVSDATTVWLELPEGRRYGERRLELFVGPSVDRMLVDEALGRPGLPRPLRPWIVPSHAATAGDLLGACAVLESMSRSGRTRNPEYGRLREHAQGLVASLAAAQRDDGGWPWPSADAASMPEVSSRVAVALGAARERGLAIAPDTLERAADYLSKAFRDASQEADERRAALQHGLAALGRGDFGALNRLHRNRNALSPAALAHAALALAAAGNEPMAADLARLLEPELLSEPGAPRQGAYCSVEKNLSWSRSRLDMTALAVLALEAALPASPKIAQGVEYLLAHRPWVGAHGGGLALAAVARYRREIARGDDVARVTVQVGDGEPMPVSLDGASPGWTRSVAVADSADRRVRVRFTLEGRAEPCFSAVLSGFSQGFESERATGEGLAVREREMLADEPRYRGRALPTGFRVVREIERSWTNAVENLPVGRTTRMVVHYAQDARRGQEREELDYLVLEVPLPAGARVLEGTFRGGLGTYEERDGALVVPLGPVHGGSAVWVSLVGVDPGSYRIAPPVLRSAYEPSRLAVGRAADFAVLERGVPSPDQYRPTPDELFHHGKLLYEDGELALAHAKLGELYRSFELRPDVLTEAARMLLFLSIERREPAEIVRYFEVVKEKDPALFVPFEQVVAIGEAYRELREYERAMLVFRATIEETFGKDLKVAGTLQEQGESAGAVDTLQKLVLEYPDLPTVVATHLALSDRLLTLARTAGRDDSLRKAGRDRASLTGDGVLVLQRFLALHPDDPLAPDAGLNLVSAHLDLEDRETASALAGDIATLYTEPRFADAFLYTRAVAEWYLGREEEALTLLSRIADAEYTAPDGGKTPSENRDLALYILGQIHHARRDAETAAEYYERVDHLFPDAREALAGFRERTIALDEVTAARPGEPVEVALRTKNLADAELSVYQVDLMTLYLREKNLSDVTAVNLAGISPALRTTVALGTGDDLRERETTARLDLPDPGAYLVICRAGALHASGLVLVTDLELDVTEDPVSGRVRVQALRQTDDGYVRGVDVRVIGTANERFVAGETDPRGLFVADGVRGAATVIARHDDRHYAFHRGTEPLAVQDRGMRGELLGGQLDSDAYLQNVRSLNEAQQAQRAQRLEDEIGRSRKGVQVQAVK